jgi:hypothetical protein
MAGPRELAEQVALGQHDEGLLGWGDDMHGKVEHHAGQLGVDLLVVLDLPVAEVEERLPADVPPCRGVAADQVVAIGIDRAGEVRQGGVKHQREERIRARVGGVAAAGGEVGPV